MLKLYRPFRPFTVTQKWGVPNNAYAQFGFTKHNGIDVAALKLTPPYSIPKTWPFYCPVEGFHVTMVRFSPNGGGNEIYLTSKEPMQIGDISCYVNLVFMHNAKVLVPVGYEPKIGELITIADNTGFSTGPHSHMGMYRVNKYGKKLDTNEANGSYDIEQFISEEYAVDKADTATLIKSGLRYYTYILGIS